MEAVEGIAIFLGLFILYDLLPPFILGIILKVILRKINIPKYVPFVLAVITWLVLFLINGKSPSRIFESDLLGMIYFIMIYAIFIKSGISTFTAFAEGLKSRHNKGLQGRETAMYFHVKICRSPKLLPSRP